MGGNNFLLISTSLLPLLLIFMHLVFHVWWSQKRKHVVHHHHRTVFLSFYCIPSTHEREFSQQKWNKSSIYMIDSHNISFIYHHYHPPSSSLALTPEHYALSGFFSHKTLKLSNLCSQLALSFMLTDEVLQYLSLSCDSLYLFILIDLCLVVLIGSFFLLVIISLSSCGFRFKWIGWCLGLWLSEFSYYYYY